MNSWTPLWSMIVDSSLWEEDDSVCKVFITMLALKDPDHVVRMTAYQIGKKANKAEKEVLKALAVLCNPDQRRIEKQEYEGRRIQKVEGGYLILNGAKYQEMMQEIVRQRKQAQWMREQRMIERAVRTGEGIDPAAMTPNIKMRYEKAKNRAKGMPLETGVADVESHVESGTFLNNGL